jgi:NDP-sugar pyrophosphorylase family protein
MLPIIVLAGGLATRLRPITDTIPKALISINNIPFVLHQLDLFKRRGIKDVHFCLGYLGKMVEDIVLGSKFVDSMNINFYYDGDKLLGTGGAIRNVMNLLPNDFFVTYGDSYLDIDYKEVGLFFKANRLNEKTALMTVFKNHNKWDSSNVVFKEGKVTLYSKKNKDPKMQYIDYGLGVLTKKDFESYKEGSIFDLADIYEGLSVNGNLLGIPMKQRFYEIGSFDGINDISNYLKNI